MTQETSAAPRVTVFMPVYNAEAFVAQTIESVLAQTLRDFEFLIIDDGSSDRSAEIVTRFAAADDRIRFTSRENRGAPTTRNELAESARAPLLAVMDADDVCRPERLERQVAFLDAHPDIDAVGSHAQMVDEKDRPIIVLSPVTDPDEIDRNNLVGQNAIIHPTVMMRADILQRAGGYRAEFPSAEDLDLWLRIGEVGRIANIPEVLLDYRLHGNSSSGSDGEGQLKQAVSACRQAWARRGLPDQELVDARWRPTQDRASRRDYALKWGWQAWKSGNQATARRFFIQAVRTDPLSTAVWKGLVFGLLKRP